MKPFTVEMHDATPYTVAELWNGSSVMVSVFDADLYMAQAVQLRDWLNEVIAETTEGANRVSP